MPFLEQAGIFKSKPLSWEVYPAESGAIGVSMKFAVLEELNSAGEWESWAEYDEHHFYGTWWVVKKDGKVNTQAVEQLAKCLGWNGNLTSIMGAPPEIVVQVTVKADTYKDKTTFKGSWMNPEDHTGGGFGADADTVKSLQSRFGSLLRAAASGSTPAAPAPAKKGGPKSKPATPPSGKPPMEVEPCKAHGDSCEIDCPERLPF